MSNIDLHIHTIYSDGTCTPEEVVCQAKKLNLVAISITDHDSVAGLEEAMTAGEKAGVEVIPGVELSTDVGEDEIHLLAYYLDHKDKTFLSHLKEFQSTRVKRNRELLKRLEELGMPISYGELKEIAGRGVISRLHIARLMVKKDYVPSIGAAFDKWIGSGKPAHVKRMKISPSQIIRIVLRAGGVPIFAHPYLSGRDDLIPALVKAGLAGIEVYHNTHSSKTREHYKEIAHEYHLLITGGSDCHGKAKDKILMGRTKVPTSLLKNLKAVAKKKNILSLHLGHD